jgi:leucyl-tRNA synthetase
MSKSKKNIVDPDDIIARYGADTARWFMLSDSPPERDVQWTQDGIEGAWRFVQKVWRLFDGHILEEHDAARFADGLTASDIDGDDARTLYRQVQLAIDAVTRELEALGFNRAVARLYELVNALSAFKARNGNDAACCAYALAQLMKLLSPMMPHLAETGWQALGGAGLVADAAWPQADTSVLTSDEVALPVQVNGKKRGEISVPKDADEAIIKEMALNEAGVKKFIDGQELKKTIIVPGRIVNLVVK